MKYQYLVLHSSTHFDVSLLVHSELVRILVAFRAVLVPEDQHELHSGLVAIHESQVGGVQVAGGDHVALRQHALVVVGLLRCRVGARLAQQDADLRVAAGGLVPSGVARELEAAGSAGYFAQHMSFKRWNLTRQTKKKKKIDQ